MDQNQNGIFCILKENILKPENVFVFQTQIAAEKWADYIIEHTQLKAVAMERFLAWDDFKRQSIKANVKDKKSIPSSMRRIFAANLIEENAKELFLHQIVPQKFASQASSFTSWITSFLPSLKSYHDKIITSKTEIDEEDKDFIEIYNRYKKFLDDHNLFDPAWIKPPFTSDQRHYFIFAPEILNDYPDYKELLESPASSPFITVVKTSSLINKIDCPCCDYFSNSREELRHVVLHARYLHEEKNIAYENMALSVPDLDTYAPYISREFELYQIPYVQHSGRSLCQSGAGAFFSQLNDCVQNEFSFTSIKTLLLNNELTWKQTKLAQELIDFGIKNNCVCSYNFEEKKIDVWLQSFKKAGINQNLVEFYKAFKDVITKIVKAKTFTEIRNMYFTFKTKFFDEENFCESSDKILSRCLIKLSELIDLEETFSDCKISSPYSIFLDELKETKYVFQNKKRGLTILPYKMAATAPFDIHFIIDASENSASVINRPMGFLREDKRFSLGLTDENVSEFFIKLYELNSLAGETYFTCAEKTFTTYSVCQGFLNEQDCRIDEEKHVDSKPIKEDLQDEEKKYLLMQQNDFPSKLNLNQKNNFKNWYDTQISFLENKEEIKLENNLFELLKNQKFFDEQKNKIRISATTLNDFFFCPRKWLFDSIYNVEEKILESNLVDDKYMGKLKHKTVEKVFKHILTQNPEGFTIFLGEDKIYKSLPELINIKTDEVFEEENDSVLGKTLLLTEKDAVKENLIWAMDEFFKAFEGYQVIASEKEMTFEEEGKNYFLNGKADLILKNPDGDLTVVDFKSSNYFKNFILYYENDNLPELQFPMYVFLMEKEYKGNVEEACYFSLARQSDGQAFKKFVIHPSSENKALTREQFEPTVNLIYDSEQNICEKFYSMLIANNFITDEKNQNFEKCSKCNYKAFCRKTFTVSGDRGDM